MYTLYAVAPVVLAQFKVIELAVLEVLPIFGLPGAITTFATFEVAWL